MKSTGSRCESLAVYKEKQKDEWRKPCLFTSDIQKWTMTSGWNEAQFGILFCEPACFFLSSVVRSSCLDFSLIITNFFRFLLNVIFDLKLDVIVFSFLSVSNYLFVASVFVGFKFAFRFRFVILRVWYWDISWIESRIYVFQAVVYGTVFNQSRRVSPGFITGLQLVYFHFLLRKPSKIWSKCRKIKIQRLVCWERENNWIRGMLWCNPSSVQEMITRSVTSVAQSGTATNRSGSLRTDLRILPI